MQFDLRTRDEEVPEFLACGHNAHWKIWHSLAKGQQCILCRAESAEAELRAIRAALTEICDQASAALDRDARSGGDGRVDGARLRLAQELAQRIDAGDFRQSGKK